MNSTGTLNHVLNKLIGDYMHQLYFQSYQEEVAYRIKWSLQEITYSPEEEKQMPYDYIMRDLFLWSILMNYIEMAKVFLSHMKYRICSALIATKILKEYYTIATYGDLKDSYSKSADYFENYAIECINKCAKNDPDTGCQIILQQIPLYGNVTCLQV
jgi:hypothetical protein